MYPERPDSQIHTLDLDSNVRLAFFGYQLEFLPDFLSDHTLLGQSDYEKLNDVLTKFSRLLVGLRKYKSAGYVLRYLSSPEQGAVQVYLLGRVIDAPGKSETLASLAASDLQKHLLSFGFSPVPLVGAGLDVARNPFGERPFSLVELRQQEEVVTLAPRGNPAECARSLPGATVFRAVRRVS
jgi:hypothetical protein